MSERLRKDIYTKYLISNKKSAITKAMKAETEKRKGYSEKNFSK